MNALPPPPVDDPQHASALRTIQTHPDLFRVVTPLKVDVFEHLLRSHPNQPLVASVCQGFREGFWPFADSSLVDLPESWEEPSGPMDDDALTFALKYASEEETAGRYSEPFEGELLPGMFSMPIHAVPKPHSNKLRFINNHSAGKFSLNSLIDKHSVGMRPDNVQDLAHNLLQYRALHGDIPLWLFKSDIANAYRILPMHPLWQLKQIVSIDGVRRVDRCCCFGSRGSPDLFCTFMSLLLWIAIHVRNVPCLLAYMDDNFSFESSTTLVDYAGYGKPISLPFAQARLLQLWDDVGVPHASEKQLYGRALTITGFLVDSESMSITLPPDACSELVSAIRFFLADAERRRRPLRDWQRLIGWINWGLNVQPLLRPALQSSYAKIAGRNIPHAPIYINARVKRDLLFIASIFERHGGIHIIKASTWGPDAADIAIYCDACLTGMAFWTPNLAIAFVADCPDAPSGLEDNIFWFEALTVLAALEWIAASGHPLPSRLAIFTDNLNTVQMFDSFRANRHFDDILLRACDILIASDIDLRVWHIAGQHNTVADALSRGLFHTALQYAPNLSVSTFIPPRPTLGDIVEC
ncbi:DNA/RNA polymerase [Trametes coccinea BRFM310]|uniref:DNA/RNA polymerase n=1 Tax=Trametes coccinea (strain BRFM310) TaxID=1353009 RepID=A0A1Y2J5H4_TRAC3|nr:DNA/RNA polymerase [Trametes coccinea BRFM310]